jgi:hypothetical protein
MFVAGIEIFFGFVAGALLLMLLIYSAFAGWVIVGNIGSAISRSLAKLPAWIERRAKWILASAIYFVAMLVLGQSHNPIMIGTSGIMWMILIVASVVKLFLLQKAKPSAKS